MMDVFTPPPPTTRVTCNNKLGNFCKDCGKLCKSQKLLLLHKSSHINFELMTDRYCFLCGIFCSNGFSEHLSKEHWKILDKTHCQPVEFKVVLNKINHK